MRNLFSLLVLIFGVTAFGANHIVLFKQNDVTISSLEHGAFTSLLQTENQKSVTQLQEWLGKRGERASVANLWLVRGAVLDIDTEVAKKLAKEPWVTGVYQDKVRQMINPVPGGVFGNSLAELGEKPEKLWGLERIGVPKIRAEFPTLCGQRSQGRDFGYWHSKSPPRIG